MTKADIVKNISDQTGVDKTDVQMIAEKFMEEIKNSLQKNNNVYLRGFGSFIIKTRAEKTGRNISKNTAVIIPAHNSKNTIYDSINSVLNQTYKNFKCYITDDMSTDGTVEKIKNFIFSEKKALFKVAPRLKWTILILIGESGSYKPTPIALFFE